MHARLLSVAYKWVLWMYALGFLKLWLSCLRIIVPLEDDKMCAASAPFVMPSVIASSFLGAVTTNCDCVLVSCESVWIWFPLPGCSLWFTEGTLHCCDESVRGGKEKKGGGEVCQRAGLFIMRFLIVLFWGVFLNFRARFKVYIDFVLQKM